MVDKMQDMAGILKFLKFLKDKALTNTLKQAASRSKEPGMGVKGPKTSLAAPPTTRDVGRRPSRRTGSISPGRGGECT